MHLLVTKTSLSIYLDNTDLTLTDYSSYRSDRKLTGNRSHNGGVRFAVSDCYNWYKFNLDLLKWALVVQMKVNKNNISFVIFYPQTEIK